MAKAIDKILIGLPKINDEWVETIEGDFYAAGWEEFQKSHPEIHNTLDEEQLRYCYTTCEAETGDGYILGYIKEVFEEAKPRLWGMQLASIEDIKSYNKSVQNVCAWIAKSIHLFVRNFLADGGQRKQTQWLNNYNEEGDLSNIYEEEWNDT